MRLDERDAQDTLRMLQEGIRSRGSVLVAFSGGLDSSVLAALARGALGDDAVAVLVDSETQPRREMEEARKVAGQIGIRLVERTHSELASEAVRRNPEDRCYHCRRGMVDVWKQTAGELGLGTVADGVIASDALEHRPGIRAATEAGVWHPLAEAGLEKEDVRVLARQLELTVSEKPPQACLSSRVPYGEPIDERKLEQIEKGEDFLLTLGFTQVRLRHHGDTARIEVPDEQVGRLTSPELSAKVVKKMKELGFTYVTADLEGYRSGSMDAVLKGGDGP